MLPLEEADAERLRAELINRLLLGGQAIPADFEGGGGGSAPTWRHAVHCMGLPNPLPCEREGEGLWEPQVTKYGTNVLVAVGVTGV